MSSYNRVELIGNLTRDPELRYTPKGKAICDFALAMNRTFKTETGEGEEVTYVDIEAWGKRGEVIAKYMAKGRPLFVVGRLKLDQWEDKASGAKRSRHKVVLEDFRFIGAPPQGADAAKAAAAAGGDADEDVPM